ncbi:MAG: type II secretion system protein GspM [Actinomycetota bacterium]|nr:type II secretion system protein GspM [Actinomycetota bacterium]
MTRGMAIVAALVAVAVAALFYFLGWRPKSERIAEIEEQQQGAEEEQATLRRRIQELEEIRANAPEVEAAIVAAESIIPRDLSLPSALRQLQLAADEAGADLVSVSPARPAQIEGAEPGFATIQVTVQVSGGYFQLVDFLRRVEDPAISPRAITWGTLAVTGDPEDYPTLAVSVTGTMFSLLPAPPQAPAPAPTPGAPGGATPGASPSPGATPTATPSPGGGG